MPSSINTAIPAFGNATTAGVRANFATAKAEIEALQKIHGIVNIHDSFPTELYIKSDANMSVLVRQFWIRAVLPA